jgi:3'-phosphoadenosine 5'-phosphosulfate (PAPS) 3'-phosphatase
MLAELERIVRTVGSLLLQRRELGPIDGKWDGPQFKSSADLMAHEKLTEHLKSLAPEVPIISEENQTSWLDPRPERYWLIDPIDGTASFAQNYLGFVTQIALMVENRPMLAAIYAPALNFAYLAECGQGAFLNGVKLFRKQTLPHKTLIDNYPEPRGVVLQAYNELGFTNYIECGSISLKICKIADGTADLFFKNVIVHDWDLAAPELVLEEAGGLLKDSNGKEIRYDGDYKQSGIVAAASEEACMHFVSWYNNFMKRGASQ